MKFNHKDIHLMSESSLPYPDTYPGGNVRGRAPVDSSAAIDIPKGKAGVLSRTQRLKRAVILAGGQNTLLNPLTKDCPCSLFPILNSSLLEHTIESIRAAGISEIVVAGSIVDNGRSIKDLDLDRWSGTTVKYVEDSKPIGTAGVLREVRDFVADESFLIVNGSTYLGDIDFEEMLSLHNDKNSLLTMGVVESAIQSNESVDIKVDGEVSFVNIPPASQASMTYLRPSGVYIMDPASLDFIEGDGYYDIKEQLIPAIIGAGKLVFSYLQEGPLISMLSFDDYFRVQVNLLHSGLFSKKGLTEVRSNVWAGKNVTIDPEAYILGPVIIGDNVSIGKGAKIIGATVIGKYCVVGEEALIRESVLWDGCVVEKNSNIAYSIGGEELKVRAGRDYKNKILVDRLSSSDLNTLPDVSGLFNDITETNKIKTSELSSLVYYTLKRLMDVVFSALGLVIFSPLMLVIAILVRYDSEGPVFFRQKRCGKGGKEFQMYKFRTMDIDAEKKQKDLWDRNNVDGPMFKLTMDPRITRVGAFLRTTSLDELPQLFNVLKGEMSLVGPRPLAKRELKFNTTWRYLRQKVKPGATGLWQVHGQSKSPFHDWIWYDTTYVKNQSLWLDIDILVKTFIVVCKRISKRIFEEQDGSSDY